MSTTTKRQHGPNTNGKPKGRSATFSLEDQPIAGDRLAEEAICILLFNSGTAEDRAWIAEHVQPRDFYWADTRFLFEESLEMHKLGVPADDNAGRGSWFRRPEVIERFVKAGLGDWRDSNGKPCPTAMVYQLCIEGQFATGAHLPFYASELRMWRLVRGLRLVAVDILHDINEDPHKALKILSGLDAKLISLHSLADSVPPGVEWKLDSPGPPRHNPGNPTATTPT